MALYKQWNVERLRSKGSYWQARILSTAVHLEVFDWFGKRANGPEMQLTILAGRRKVGRSF